MKANDEQNANYFRPDIKSYTHSFMTQFYFPRASACWP